MPEFSKLQNALTLPGPKFRIRLKVERGRICQLPG
jgi:hypothetical protein